LIYLIISFLTFLITVVSTPFLIQFLIKKDIVDKPNGEERRMHNEPIPRLGGIIIFAVVFIITLAFYHNIYSIIFFIAGALIAFGLGLVDDIKAVRWQTKFIFQSVAAALLVLFLNANHLTVIKFLGFTLLPGMNYLVLFILIVGLLNAFNFMDGLDGLVSGYSLIVASMCFLLNMGSGFSFISYLSAAIIGTTLGFLKFNANPARIFLGDSGSLTLGYLITGMVIIISGEVSANPGNNVQAYSNTINLTFIIIALAVPLLDTIRVMLVRLKQRKHLFLADSNHLHHILLSKKIRHKTVVLVIHIFSVMFVLLAMYYAKYSQSTALIVFTVLLILFFTIQYILGFLIKKGLLISYSNIYNKIPDLFPKFYRIFLLPAVLILLISLFIILLISDVSQSQSYYKYFLLFIIPALLYSSTTLRKNNYYAELLALVNLILFFVITGLNGFFYKLYPIPIINQININQILIIILSGMIIFFVLFKERVASIRQQFLTGTDLTLAVLIMFIYIAVQLVDIPNSYRISDILLRSYLVFLFYKIIITVKPRIHFSLYYISFFVALIAVLKSIF